MMTTTKEQILDAAGKLIHVRGFKNTSVDDILKETGVGKGNFYYYFKSKDELGYAILDRKISQITTELIEKSFISEKNPWEQITQIRGEGSTLGMCRCRQIQQRDKSSRGARS